MQTQENEKGADAKAKGDAAIEHTANSHVN